ncbi:MAG: helix-turn-helix transcriptional regulator [Selenomonas ruminantium]|jgi:transcriptional regulator with XRE-family HTH domain|uniref:Helix-turn-helix transcriptional regulator n=1 Tax=Selenomonas ruminantium TaxID=971 RepID=A0A927ZPF9_SELRU|nr:helix-turn-helix transcriptional regulator [Selenomonas ruminantium]MBE6084014.1 helix-turn-helix transcriptional regulator [Selenomonas ruminantium]
MSVKIELRLKQLLSEKDMTQKSLAEKTGIRESTISDITRGARTVMNFEHIARIAEALNIEDIRDLILLKKR